MGSSTACGMHEPGRQRDDVPCCVSTHLRATLPFATSATTHSCCRCRCSPTGQACWPPAAAQPDGLDAAAPLLAAAAVPRAVGADRSRNPVRALQPAQPAQPDTPGAVKRAAAGKQHKQPSSRASKHAWQHTRLLSNSPPSPAAAAALRWRCMPLPLLCRCLQAAVAAGAAAVSGVAAGGRGDPRHHAAVAGLVLGARGGIRRHLHDRCAPPVLLASAMLCARAHARAQLLLQLRRARTRR